MALTALEWLALPEDEREKRKGSFPRMSVFFSGRLTSICPKDRSIIPKGL